VVHFFLFSISIQLTANVCAKAASTYHHPERLWFFTQWQYFPVNFALQLLPFWRLRYRINAQTQTCQQLDHHPQNDSRRSDYCYIENSEYQQFSVFQRAMALWKCLYMICYCQSLKSTISVVQRHSIGDPTWRMKWRELAAWSHYVNLFWITSDSIEGQQLKCEDISTWHYLSRKNLTIFRQKTWGGVTLPRTSLWQHHWWLLVLYSPSWKHQIPPFAMAQSGYS
jgi:hypothetical protein